MNRWRKLVAHKFGIATVALFSASLGGSFGCGANPEPMTGGSGGSDQGGAGGAGGSGGMGGAGGETECMQPSDCGVDTVCVMHACMNGSCVPSYAKVGTLWDTQTPGDCKRRVCNGQGTVIEQSDESDVQDDFNDCTLDQCTNGLPESIPYSAGTVCSSNGGKVCNQNGECVQCLVASDCASNLCMSNVCVAATCGDALKNGSETDKDCGGSECLPCVDGRVCLVASDCQSSVCEMGKCAVPSCADGVKNGSESGVDCGGACMGCGLGLACSVNGDCASSYCVGGACVDAVCGDGIITGSEVCDDGNTNAGDCCNGCQLEVGPGCEVEANDTDATANDWNAVALNGKVKALNDPTLDKDVYRIDVPAGVTGNLTAEVLDGPLGTTCASGYIDSYLSIRDSAGTTLGSDDDSGTGFCSLLAVSGLAPGLYYVEQQRTTSGPGGRATYDYTLGLRMVLCGDGFVDDSEQCEDGNTASGDGCSSQCSVEPGYACTGTPSVCATVCGDGFKAGMETCDDGNMVAGDCCTSDCQAGPGCEIEPNNTDATANNWNAMAINNVMKAFNDPANDLDVFRINVPTGFTGALTAEVLDGPLGTTCASNNIDSYLTLRNSAGTTLADDDDSGPGFCSLLTVTNLASGAYYVEQKRRPSAPRGFATYDYTLKLAMTLCGNSVVEGPEQCDDGNTTSGDGCSAACTVETAYDCTGVPSVCTAWETICNDGLDNDGDGSIDDADSNCTLPAYFPACDAGAHETLWVFKSPSLNVEIPDYSATGVTPVLTIPDIGHIVRVAMLYNITHTDDAHLDITLTPPVGGALDVCSDNGGSGDNFVKTVLDSTCPTSITAGFAPFSGCYQPENAFTSFVGKNAQGTWTIKVVDDGGGAVGTLQDWAMIFCMVP